MPPGLKPIEPLPERWEPTADPNDIVVPGLDTNAPAYDQIEQIEQLITIKLQNIDANFSKMQHIMANRILPAVKRYAVGTEPVREAARFWTTFFEQAAQIRVPTYDEYSSVNEQEETEPSSDVDPAQAEQSSSSAEGIEATPTRSHHTTYTSDGSSDDSFMPQAALSSTPATAFRHRTTKSQESFADGQTDPTPSWSASLESPLLRLAGEVQILGQDEVSAVSEHTAGNDDSEDMTQRAIPLPHLSFAHVDNPSDSAKGKGREMPPPLLQGVLRRNATLTDTTSPRKPAYSPLKLKPKTPVAKTLNPYLPPGSKPTEWKGVVDLADPSSATPRKAATSSSSLDLTARPGSHAQSTTPRHAGDDSLDVDFGMSPPVTMDFARLPKLGKTPKKEAAQRIFQGLLDVEKRGVFAAPPAAGTRAGGKTNGAEPSGSSIPTPPSLSRYQPDPQPSLTGSSLVDASLERMMRQVGIMSDSGTNGSQTSADRPPMRDRGQTNSKSSSASTSSSIFPSRPPTFTAAPPPAPQTPPPPQYDFRHIRDDDLDGGMDDGGLDDSLDSMDSGDYEGNNTANPSAAFLFASQGGGNCDEDDSFASDDTDDFADDDVGAPIEEYPPEGDSFDDDSFDNEFDGPPEEETVFGVPPAERLRLQTRDSDANLRMYGADLLQDTLGVGKQILQAGRVEDTPTPFVAPKQTEESP
ncbi:uncharacterized protein C8Q71DRAFT_809348 [Rhodofomes roseus]|uniref:DASH complex subunit ASK1 n=1 Tax=Rhodofomes roseus TaxID=34475 RepID=A0ABQ8KHF2_9APHY|nr:uncharacterized protein C8Q71DRAFT_809348 [Rhodofomes roseus]KAH9837232.1 hypothetical protein C8Q71DRAFT_809348 [Rhodofomes roseus]